MSNHDLVMKFERIDRCSKTWEAIFQETPNRSPLLSYDWFLALCDNLLKTDVEVMVFSEDNRPIGIMPAFIKENTLRLTGDERVTDHNDIIYLPGYEHKILQEMALFIKNNGLRVDLFPLEPDSLLVLHLPGFLDILSIEKADPCPILHLPDSWEKYLISLESKMRHELRRKLRKTSDTEIKVLEPDQIGILFRLMCASDRGKQNFLKPEICGFFKAIASSFAKRGWLRFRAAFLNSRPIATIFSFSLEDKIYLYNTGFDPDYYHLSPGIATIGMDIKAAINQGFGYYDFLRGRETYKLHFGAMERCTMRLRG